MALKVISMERAFFGTRRDMLSYKTRRHIARLMVSEQVLIATSRQQFSMGTYLVK